MRLMAECPAWMNRENLSPSKIPSCLELNSVRLKYMYPNTSQQKDPWLSKTKPWEGKVNVAAWPPGLLRVCSASFSRTQMLSLRSCVECKSIIHWLSDMNVYCCFHKDHSKHTETAKNALQSTIMQKNKQTKKHTLIKVLQFRCIRF